MTTKVVKSLKQITLFLMLCIGIMSCEKDIENVGVNLVENGVFDTQKYNSSVIAYNQNIIKRRANNLGEYLLGTYSNGDFGSLQASIITQLAPPNGFEGFGANPSIDAVILTLPYQATNNGLKSVEFPPSSEIYIDVPDLVLDSVWGNQNESYFLNVYRLETYLNTLDPSNPSEELDYFTNQTYNYNSSALYSELFTPSESDSIYIIERPEFLENSVIDKDTIRTFQNNSGTSNLLNLAKASDINSRLIPSIRLPLDKTFFTDNFLNNNNVLDEASFIEFFNGLVIEAMPNGNPAASIMSLDLSSQATNITIYYTNTDEGERTKQSVSFNFSGVTANTYTRDYSGSQAQPFLDNPNTLSGDERLYLHGAAGSIGLIDLFTLDNINELRNNDWLINEANLTFYVDQQNPMADFSIAPDQLFVYNYDENTYLKDIFSEGLTSFDGTLERDEDGNPYRYIINITDYISDVLNSDEPIEHSKLIVKVHNTSDTPIQTTTIDSEIGDYSWTPKGVVLFGNHTSNLEKRLKLEITYTEVN